MERVRVFLYVEVLLHFAPRIREERPLRSHSISELVALEDVVRRNGHNLRVGHCDLWIKSGQRQVLLVILGAEVPP